MILKPRFHYLKYPVIFFANGRFELAVVFFAPVNLRIAFSGSSVVIQRRVFFYPERGGGGIACNNQKEGIRLLRPRAQLF
jgi:hypothetical protein